ncbi:MAG: diadenylate cyclase, partial [Myxococcota bacterium]
MIRDWLVEPLLTASLVDWLDIVLLTVVVYGLLRAMQATRAFQSLVGLSLLFVLLVVSDWVHFTTLHWVLDNLFEVLVIALLILFQDDIRRALARAGGTFFNGTVQAPRRAEAGVMEEVIKACFALAHRRIGALIVIERTMPLERFTEGAHAVDAVVSTELLQSVFHPSSPLHDGAIVVSGERIV